MPRRNRLPVVGDIFELKTPKGLVYLQYTHWDKTYIHLARALPGFFRERPASFKDLAKRKETNYFFTHLGVSDFAFVSHEPVPTWAVPFPLMKTDRGLIDRYGNATKWWLYSGDGKPSVDVGSLSAQQRALPTVMIYSPSVIADQLTMGWRPEMDTWPYEERAKFIKKNSLMPREGSSTLAGTEFFLYFPSQRIAKNAGERLQRTGHAIRVEKNPDGSDWLLVIVTEGNSSREEREEMDKQLEILARELGGRYDGSASRIA